MAEHIRKTPHSRPLSENNLAEAARTIRAIDAVFWGEFCGHCGVLLSLESNEPDADCGQFHVAVQLAHAWLECDSAQAVANYPFSGSLPGECTASEDGKHGDIACGKCGAVIDPAPEKEERAESQSTCPTCERVVAPYFNAEADNYYCPLCNGGMGNDYYASARKAVAPSIPEEPKAASQKEGLEVEALDALEAVIRESDRNTDAYVAARAVLRKAGRR